MSEDHSDLTSTELTDGSTNASSRTDGSTNASSRIRKRSRAAVEGNEESIKWARLEESLVETEAVSTNTKDEDKGTSPDQSNEPSATAEEDRSIERGHVLERQDSAVDEHASNGQSQMTSSVSDAEDSMYDGSGGSTPKARQLSNSEHPVRNEDAGGSNSWNEDEGGALKEGKTENDKQPRRPRLYQSTWSQSDTLQYRLKYLEKKDDSELNDNYKFYANEIPSCPDGDFINVIHNDWLGQYSKLEYHHGYIQWLFPIREHGMNYHSQELQLHEAKRICSDPVMHERVLKSYELMLDFYGMKLKDRNTGEIERADNWKERFHHLNHSSHNYLRITRILKCLGEMEYEQLKAPFLRFVLHEAIEEGTLDHTLDSCINYWLEVLKSKDEREDVRKYAQKLADKVNQRSDNQSRQK